jgi:DNA-binding protein H-NS
MHVLTQALSYPQQLLAEGQSLPPGLTATMAEYGETLCPELALLGPLGGELAGKPQLLIGIFSAEQSLDKPAAGKHWKATPATRMMELLHVADVALGLVTNGEQWMLVFAPRGDTTGFTSWYASLWMDEPITLRAFQSLLSARRFFGVAASDTLLAILKESAQDQQEVTNQLGEQVRDAVEVLIQAFDHLDQGSGRRLLDGVNEKSLYDAALTVMMRLVFLFSAEERSLLHLGKPVYDDNYAVSTLREQLQEVADRYGEEVLERRHDAWARLLAVFRAVHGGVSHQDLMLPAYGGSLFDPDRYPFLEGRPQGTGWRTKPAEPLRINNRVVLHLLKSLQMLQVKVPGGGPAEARRISFLALDIEQIGHIYEGLLDHTAVRASEVVLGLRASPKKPVPSMSLSELEALRQQDESKLIQTVEEATDRSAKALEKALKNGDCEQDFHKVVIACGQDQKLVDRVRVFSGLLRHDSFERPVIVLPGSIYVGQGSARRSTGTHYTPRSLTEPIVQYTLEPLVYQGPAEGLLKEQWRLKSPKQILELKICDMAMGSGAFLVQVCRYLSERLVEAWENLEKEHPGEVLITPEGQFSQGEPSERLIPKETAERLAIARRLVADRCIFGVDINPMAVEMAKLSIWLITVDKTRPFTFLDHALKCGDSLLGIARFKQLETFSLDDEHAKQVIILSNYDELIRTAIAKRRELEMLPSNDAAQIAAKEALFNEAEERLEQLKLAADLLIAAELTEGNRKKKEMARVAAHFRVSQCIQKPAAEFRRFAQDQLGDSRTFHWPLEFPEVFVGGGFHAIVGNPPYMGGPKLTGTLGRPYRDYLVEYIAGGKKGTADLAAYFCLRVYRVVRVGGYCGLIVTSSIAEGDTRQVGLQQVLERGATLIRAVRSSAWPGAAKVTYTAIWLYFGSWSGLRVLDEELVEGITALLAAAGASHSQPVPLACNRRLSFNGVKVDGEGFVVSPGEKDRLILNDAANGDVLFPYLTGEMLNSCPENSSSMWAIRFFDWPLDRRTASADYEGKVAADYPDCLRIVEERVKPERTRLDDHGNFVHEITLAQKWWIYKRRCPALYASIKHLDRVLAIATGATKYVAFALASTRTVFSHSLAIIATDSMGLFAAISSSLHDAWARYYGSYNLKLLRYSPSDVFDTFALPVDLPDLEEIGSKYYNHRRGIMLDRQEGLTSTYNRLHSPSDVSPDIATFRVLQSEMDHTVAAAYGWTELDLGHGFYETKDGVRFTISDSARRTVLDRLLSLNHQRYKEEVDAGLHEKKAKGGSRKRGFDKDKLETSTSQGALYKC